jgi:hypothetical protein
VDVTEWQLREEEQGLSVFEKVEYPSPLMVVAAVGLRKKSKYGLGAFALKREEVWGLGLRFIRTLGGTGVPPVDAIHFDIRLSFFREVSFSWRADQKRQYFNSVISPQLQALSRPVLDQPYTGP